MVGWQRCKSLGPSLEQHQRAEEGQAGGISARERCPDLDAARPGMGTHIVLQGCSTRSTQVERWAAPTQSS